MSDSQAPVRRSTCSATTKSGAQCRAYASADSGKCCFHGPKSHEYQRNGGRCSSIRHRAFKRLPEPLASLLAVLQKAVDEVHAGKLSPAAGSSMASLVGCIVKALETADIMKRLELLEEQMQKDVRR